MWLLNLDSSKNLQADHTLLMVHGEEHTSLYVGNCVADLKRKTWKGYSTPTRQEDAVITRVDPGVHISCPALTLSLITG